MKRLLVALFMPLPLLASVELLAFAPVQQVIECELIGLGTDDHPVDVVHLTLIAEVTLLAQSDEGMSLEVLLQRIVLAEEGDDSGIRTFDTWQAPPRNQWWALRRLKLALENPIHFHVSSTGEWRVTDTDLDERFIHFPRLRQFIVRSLGQLLLTQQGERMDEEALQSTFAAQTDCFTMQGLVTWDGESGLLRALDEQGSLTTESSERWVYQRHIRPAVR